MIIERKKTYSVVCDKCGEYYHDSTNAIGWLNQSQALDNAVNSGGWVEDGGNLYCPRCYEQIINKIERTRRFLGL